MRPTPRSREIASFIEGNEVWTPPRSPDALERNSSRWSNCSSDPTSSRAPGVERSCDVDALPLASDIWWIELSHSTSNGAIIQSRTSVADRTGPLNTFARLDAGSVPTTRKTDMSDRMFLTLDEVIDRYRGQISEGTLRNWRSMRVGPSFLKLSKAVLYPVEELERWDRRNLIVCRPSRSLSIEERVSNPCHRRSRETNALGLRHLGNGCDED